MRAEDRLQQLGTSRAYKTGEAQHFAFIQLKGYVIYTPAHVGKMLYLEDRLTRLIPAHKFAVCGLVELTANHEVNHRLLVHVFALACFDVFAVAQDRNLVCNLHDLFQFMGNIQNRNAAAAQIIHNLEQEFNLAFRKRRRRFVHNQHFGTKGHCLYDLEKLLFGYAQVFDDRVRADVIDPQLVEKRLRIPVHLYFVDEQSLFGHPSNIYVFRGRHMRRERQFLMNHRDPRELRFLRLPEEDRLSFKFHSSFVRRINAGQYIHQRGLARAVFTNDRVHFSAVNIKAYIVKSSNTWEDLRYAV